MIDSGADRTVFREALLERLRLSIVPSPIGSTLAGIGGTSDFVSVTAILEFIRDDGGTARVRGPFAVFTDPEATEMSIIGRDVLDNFDVILSRRRSEVLLLAPNHQYRVASA